jgi:hypothetical protein
MLYFENSKKFAKKILGTWVWVLGIYPTSWVFLGMGPRPIPHTQFPKIMGTKAWLVDQFQKRINVIFY